MILYYTLLYYIISYLSNSIVRFMTYRCFSLFTYLDNNKARSETPEEARQVRFLFLF